MTGVTSPVMPAHPIPEWMEWSIQVLLAHACEELELAYSNSPHGASTTFKSLGAYLETRNAEEVADSGHFNDAYKAIVVSTVAHDCGFHHDPSISCADASHHLFLFEALAESSSRAHRHSEKVTRMYVTRAASHFCALWVPPHTRDGITIALSSQSRWDASLSETYDAADAILAAPTNVGQS